MGSGASIFDVINAWTSSGANMNVLLTQDTATTFNTQYDLWTTYWASAMVLLQWIFAFAFSMLIFWSCVNLIYIPFTYLINGLLKRFSRWFL